MQRNSFTSTRYSFIILINKEEDLMHDLRSQGKPLGFNLPRFSPAHDFFAGRSCDNGIFCIRNVLKI